MMDGIIVYGVFHYKKVRFYRYWKTQGFGKHFGLVIYLWIHVWSHYCVENTIQPVNVLYLISFFNHQT